MGKLKVFAALLFSVLLEISSSTSDNVKLRESSLLKRDQTKLSANQSVLPPGWSGEPLCFAECGSGAASGPLVRFLMGASFTDPVNLTIESCVAFCEKEGYIMAGLIGDECRCSNIYNPDTCFESDFGECDFGDSTFDDPFGGRPCPGNPVESCGNNLPIASPQLYNIFFKDECRALWKGGAKVTSGPWRLIWFYNDTVGARILPHNAVDLHPGLPRGNLTVDTCLNACNASGFSLAGLEFADECYCGNALENNGMPLPGSCAGPTNAAAMRCKGDPTNFCGGPNLLYLYSLPPGNGLTPLFPFDPVFDGYCEGDCNEFGAHT